jgi:acid phosphatase (class A)
VNINSLKLKMMRSRLLLAVVLPFLTAIARPQPAVNLEPVSKHYKTLSLLNGTPDSKRAYMDTITFPWFEYSRGAIVNSLLRTVYLNATDEAKLPSLISYPANSSEQTRAELDFLLKLQVSRTPEQVKRAEFIAAIGSSPSIVNPADSDYAANRNQLFYIAESVGSWYKADNFPFTARLLMNAIQDIRATEFRLKRYFKRARPYHLEPRLKPLARIASPSFASGHTLWAFTQAFVFSEIIPEKRNGFIDRAEEVRWSRELMGIHYPSDNEASRIIAWQLLQSWKNNPQFVYDLEQAKIEWQMKRNNYK